jgi:PAS domain S-box-containing protein
MVIEKGARRRMNEELSGGGIWKEVPEQIRAVTDALPLLIAYFDSHSKLRFINRAFADYLKIFGAQLPEISFSELFKKKSPPHFTSHFEEALSGTKKEFECDSFDDNPNRFIRAAFSPDFDSTGSVRGVIIVLSDVSNQKREEIERRRLTAEQREKEELLRLIVERADAYAIIMMDPAGIITSWNPGAEKMLGYSQREAIGRHSEIIFTPEDRQKGAVAQEMLTALSDRKSPDERWHLKKDGSRFWGSGFLVALKDDAGELRGFVKILRDLTEEKRSDDAILALNNELERRVELRTCALKETNEQLEAFCYSVAHDLRAPLRAMQGFSQALIEDYSAVFDETGLDYARRIHGSAERMDTLIQDLLAYSRLSRAELRMEKVDLENVIQAAIDSFREKIISLNASVNIRGPFPAILGHSATLEQMIANLLSNALKFTVPNQPPVIEIWMEWIEKGVCLCVRDSGIGIPDQYLDRIFKIFERLYGSETYTGTGIGLAIVKKGAERMGATVGVNSKFGAGSTFWIQFAPDACIPAATPRS